MSVKTRLTMRLRLLGPNRRSAKITATAPVAKPSGSPAARIAMKERIIRTVIHSIVMRAGSSARPGSPGPHSRCPAAGPAPRPRGEAGVDHGHRHVAAVMERIASAQEIGDGRHVDHGLVGPGGRGVEAVAGHD